nr:Aminoglycoside 3''-nucleotidyltransferase [Escherichia coli O25b:H4-ST131]
MVYDCFWGTVHASGIKQQALRRGSMFDVWSSNDVTQQGSRPKTKLDIMRVVTIEFQNQLSEVLSVIERHLNQRCWPYICTARSGWRPEPYSDIDLLVTATVGLMKQRGEL